MSRSSKRLFPSDFPTTPVCTSPLLHTCHSPRPSHSPWLDNSDTIRWGLQIMKLLIIQPLPVPPPRYLDPLKPKYIPQNPNSRTPSACFPPSMWEAKFHTHIEKTKLQFRIFSLRQSHWLRGLKCRSAAARLLRLWVQITPRARKLVCCIVCCHEDISLRRAVQSSRGRTSLCVI